MNLCYSKTTNGFYPIEFKEDYEKAGTWPTDTVEITKVEQATYQGQNPPDGFKLGADENGRPVWVEVPPASIADRRDAAKKSIDQAAGNARQRYVSVGQMVEEEYRLALQQCKEWRAAGSPAASVPAAISDWAIVSGTTDELAAVNIEQTAAYWDQILLNVRNLRLSGKAAIDAATDLGTHDDMQTKAQYYIDQLNAMKP